MLCSGYECILCRMLAKLSGAASGACLTVFVLSLRCLSQQHALASCARELESEVKIKT